MPPGKFETFDSFTKATAYAGGETANEVFVVESLLNNRHFHPYKCWLVSTIEDGVRGLVEEMPDLTYRAYCCSWS